MPVPDPPRSAPPNGRIQKQPPSPVVVKPVPVSPGVAASPLSTSTSGATIVMNDNGSSIPTPLPTPPPSNKSPSPPPEEPLGLPNTPKGNGRPVSTDAQGAGQKSKKQMTKAERRAEQEAQRAAKAARTADGGGSAGAGRANAAPKTPNKQQHQQQHQSQQQQQPQTPRAATSSSSSRPNVGRRKSDAPPPRLSEDAAAALQARGIRIFSHFGSQTKPGPSKGAIHPAIGRLALQFSSFTISGANARCIATLNTLKQVIQDYTTPPATALCVHLPHYISPQINHLVNARPMCVTMGNAISYLKGEIQSLGSNITEQDAKEAIYTIIDNYIREKIIIADEVIQETAGKKIKDGDVIMTYARSSVVEKTLLRAHSSGKRFSVIVIDSRPMLEGKRLLRSLSRAGIPCTYALLPALGSLVPHTNLVFLGAQSLNTNGAVFSRAGTALVAMMAKTHSVPVVVCCETYKFPDLQHQQAADKRQPMVLDSFTRNEIAPLATFASQFPLSKPKASLTLQPAPHLEILNPLYDLTPPSSITAVVTEVGIVPPSSISMIPAALGKTSI